MHGSAVKSSPWRAWLNHLAEQGDEWGVSCGACNYRAHERGRHRVAPSAGASAPELRVGCKQLSEPHRMVGWHNGRDKIMPSDNMKYRGISHLSLRLIVSITLFSSTLLCHPTFVGFPSVFVPYPGLPSSRLPLWAVCYAVTSPPRGYSMPPTFVGSRFGSPMASGGKSGRGGRRFTMDNLQCTI